MELRTGTRLGPYEILGAVGAGGMGEVYRARDTRLDRDVAIKVLPAEFSATPECRRRLEREARAISALSHPHICTLYDVGQQDGVDYLVMEYLDGETLEQRLQRGPLKSSQVINLGAEIADALDKAHRKGFVHRDLKPGNIMLTKGGAKLLDFGLAKPISISPANLMTMQALGATATAAKPLTAEGALVGTFQYMAPEQLDGKEADARSHLRLWRGAIRDGYGAARIRREIASECDCSDTGLRTTTDVAAGTNDSARSGTFGPKMPGERPR